MGHWIFRIQAHPCHLTANSPPQPFVSSGCPTPVAYSLSSLLRTNTVPFRTDLFACSHMFLSRSHLQASILSQCRLRNITWFSTQFTVHSSQLTPQPFRFSVADSPQPPNFPNIQAKKLVAVLIPTSHEEFSFCGVLGPIFPNPRQQNVPE
jgi:hypothetical protein